MPAYRSYCWVLGNTAFRTRDFNRTIEVQLSLLDEFWTFSENQNQPWDGETQVRYYHLMKERQFLTGDAPRKDKDAREKTAGLVDLGLLDSGRRLTGAGRKLLSVSKSGDFSPDNFLQIPRDSFLYLKQLLKMSCDVGGVSIRPFLVLLRALDRFGALSMEEFTYLLPLCVSRESTERILGQIRSLRAGETEINDIILSHLMDMENYQEGLALFLNSPVDEDLLCEVGMNRKSRSYDRPYAALYRHLYDAYVEGRDEAFAAAFEAAKKVVIGALWKKYLFHTNSLRSIQEAPREWLNPTWFDGAGEERELKEAFFKVMHLLKARATLLSYLDLNRRYIGTSDVVLFTDETVALDIVPKHFFHGVIEELYGDAFSPCPLLGDDCPLRSISPGLAANEAEIIDGVNAELGVHVNTMEDARLALESVRYQRLHNLIRRKFDDQQLLNLLDWFGRRDDVRIRAAVTDNADIPTIFEYVIGILWYRISGYQGKILDYMKLSLDADLLPRTHAAGGEADIVYAYEETDAYPAHTLLLEATLTDSANQRRMEMEPVSRHLGMHLLRTGETHAYCVFAAPCLDINVLSDFRGRRDMRFYDPKNLPNCVHHMKIIPLETGELKTILRHHRTYRELYPLFHAAYLSDLPPHKWYEACIKKEL